MTNDTFCIYGFEVVEELKGKNVTSSDELAWPCGLRIFWVDFLPFVTLARGLLSYGTSIIVAVGILLNTLTLLVLTRKNMCKSPTNLYLSALTIYDTLTLTVNLMVGVLRGQNESVNELFQRNEGLCMFHGVVVELFNLLSVWIIVAFTCDRLFIIKFPLRARKASRRNAFAAVTLVSGILVLISLHKIAVSGFEDDSVFGYKACKTRQEIVKEIIYFYVALNTWIPTILIVAINIVLILEIKKGKNNRQKMTNSSISRPSDRLTKILLLISTTYVLLVLPLGIVQTIELVWNSIQNFIPGEKGYEGFMITKIKLKWIRAFFFFFYQLNFAINFFLYVTSSSTGQFRANLKKMLGMKTKNVIASPRFSRAVSNRQCDENEVSRV
ncbi:hypothetical protein CHS0354_039447 [Potamilus streckersoni]|uniref:G-protein coupled receptors family 1 profile domain-containing protein n=1 Tax=Potamilus streckersoni TaxID=2493646 RepID=A0AAE0S1T2_9BIVA|nr:hypothetical protein CHS0354_039447 [Potamilus streckersoni]